MKCLHMWEEDWVQSTLQPMEVVMRRGLGFLLAFLVMANVGLFGALNLAEAQTCPREKRGCQYVGDPNPSCELCNGCICWTCDQDCDLE